MTTRPCRVCGGTPARTFLNGPLCAEHAPFVPVPPADSSLVALRALAGLPEIAAPTAAGSLERARANYVRPGKTHTSHAAARNALPKSGTQRRRILDALLDAHKLTGGGATDPELSRHLSIEMNSVRPRRGELVEMLLVEDSGRTRTHNGSEHTVWRCTNTALAALGHRPE